MIKNICPRCGSKNVVEIEYGSEGRDTKSHYHMTDYIFDNINRDFYCKNCRHLYSTDDLKKKDEDDKEKLNRQIVFCIIFKDDEHKSEAEKK